MTKEQKSKITELRSNGCGYSAIAAELEISKETVKSFCRRNGLTSGVTQQTVPPDCGCKECGKGIVQPEKMKTLVFCSKECRVKWWNKHPENVNKRAVYSFSCACCGKNFTAYGNSKRKFCSHNCYIQSRFKGGEFRV